MSTRVHNHQTFIYFLFLSYGQKTGDRLLTSYSQARWQSYIILFDAKSTPTFRVLKCIRSEEKSEIHFWTLNRICKYILSVVSVSKKYRKHSVICILWGFMIHVWMWFIYLCLFFSLEKAIHKSHLLSQTTNAQVIWNVQFF